MSLRTAIDNVQEELTDHPDVWVKIKECELEKMVVIPAEGCPSSVRKVAASARRTKIASENSLMLLTDSQRRLVNAETDQIKHKNKGSKEWANLGVKTGLLFMYPLLAYDIAIRLISVLW